VKKAIILLHGAVGSARQVEPLFSFLPGEFQVHALNLPGHGGLAIPSEPYSFPLFAQSVLDYINKKRIEKVSLFGYSMGGYVSLYLAANYPEHIDKVFTLGTKLNWNSEFAEKEVSMLNPEKISEKVPAFAKSLEQTHSPQDWKIVLRKTSELLLNLGRQPALTERDFASIKLPVTISLGELDKMATVEESKDVVKHLQNGRYLQLDATPHPFEKVNHQILAEQMAGFFGE
jgi:pimeloyl-ACP methyl ester carboxylesterase